MNKLLGRIETALDKISKKFGVKKDFSFSIHKNEVGEIKKLDLKIKEAVKISGELPPAIIKWSPLKIEKKILPILEELAET